MNSPCRRFACIAIFLFAVTVGLASQLPDLSGKVVGVHDGDTITLLTAGRNQVKVRLEGIDAPELNQDFGNAAKKALSELVFGQKVVVHQKGLDRYKRTLGRGVCRCNRRKSGISEARPRVALRQVQQ